MQVQCDISAQGGRRKGKDVKPTAANSIRMYKSSYVFVSLIFIVVLHISRDDPFFFLLIILRKQIRAYNTAMDRLRARETHKKQFRFFILMIFESPLSTSYYVGPDVFSIKVLLFYPPWCISYSCHNTKFPLFFQARNFSAWKTDECVRHYAGQNIQIIVVFFCTQYQKNNVYGYNLNSVISIYACFFTYSILYVRVVWVFTGFDRSPQSSYIQII